MSLDLHSIQFSRGCRNSVKRGSDTVYFHQKGRSRTIVHWHPRSPQSCWRQPMSDLAKSVKGRSILAHLWSTLSFERAKYAYVTSHEFGTPCSFRWISGMFDVSQQVIKCQWLMYSVWSTAGTNTLCIFWDSLVGIVASKSAQLYRRTW